MKSNAFANDNNDPVIFITGAASGLGKAAVIYFLSKSWRVVAFDCHDVTVQSTKDSLLVVAGDVTDEASIQNAISMIDRKWGRVDVLLNAAGILLSSKVLSKRGVMAQADFERVIQVNLLGCFNVTRLLSSYMSECLTKDENQVIINVASVAARCGQVGQVAYSASKGGVLAMTTPLARELARFGIRVVCISPGVMNTEMMAQVSDKAIAHIESSILYPRRMGEPGEFVSLVEHIINNAYLNAVDIELSAGIQLPHVS